MEHLRNKKEVAELFDAILSLQTQEECFAFFEDACTVKEILDIAQRLRAAKMLSRGENYVEVGRETGMSTATISRVKKCLDYGKGGYALVLSRTVKGDHNENK